MQIAGVLTMFSKLHDKGVFQLLVIAAIVAGFFLLSESLKPEPSSGQKVLAATPLPAETGVVKVAATFEKANAEQVPVKLSGTVKSVAEVDIAARVAGAVIEVGASYRTGGSFKKGDLLFRIDPADYELALEATLAELAAAESDLALMEARADIAEREWKTLFPDQPITALGARRPQVAAARARLDSAVAARKKAGLDLERTRVLAPFDGRMLDAGLDEGQIVNANQSVGKAYATDQVEIEVPVSMGDLAALGSITGRRVVLMDAVNGKPAGAGWIDRAGAALDEKSRMVTLFVRADNPGRLMPGQYLEIVPQLQKGSRAENLSPAVAQAAQLSTSNAVLKGVQHGSSR